MLVAGMSLGPKSMQPVVQVFTRPVATWAVLRC